MSASFGILRVAPFAGFVQRFDDLIGSATTMSLYFIHSRRWRENHDAAIKAFVARAGTTLEVFLPDLENHELMYSLGKHFEDGPLIPALVGDAYRYFARLARDFGKPAHVWLFGRYPTYSFYKFDDGAVIACIPTPLRKRSCRRSRSPRTAFWQSSSRRILRTSRKSVGSGPRRIWKP